MRLVLSFGLAAIGWVACTPESQILTGRWQSREAIGPLATGNNDALLLEHGMELYLGHYGPDVVGVMRFYEQPFSANDDLGHNIPPDAGCACTWLENGRYRDSRRFTFLLTEEKNDGCLPDGVHWPGTTTKLQLEFELYRVDDDMLAGVVSTIGSVAIAQPIVFVRDPLDTELSGPEKMCEP